ncbi:hypothetical protein H257_17634 [Aphanomyces astaci]|uniref:Uncharacterized protein n=1 Tax=Aphanomyces astaci TaxID=112090 RepID=W4FG34_APHAT|nr:hypothetical protein H257_17634 [Aphanomyces astaci]ETV65693.1 hypothetical protein H257_17634 [Aphanomyces astaci]|eukprot:XP_009844800.1 hypothetical protein H257_17634 [Aphanomyces astaci]
MGPWLRSCVHTAYHLDLQPIEYVWAYLKGNVGQQYTMETTMTTMEDVRKKVLELNTYVLSWKPPKKS